MARIIITFEDTEEGAINIRWDGEKADYESDEDYTKLTAAKAIGNRVIGFIQNLMVEQGMTTNIQEYNQRVIEDYLAENTVVSKEDQAKAMEEIEKLAKGN